MFSRWVSVSSLLLGLGVMIGAFGAHALKDVLDPYSREVYEKAVFYHLTHAVGMLAVAVGGGAGVIDSRAALRALRMLCAGVVIFSGSLYLLAITGARWLGAITPIGGTLFIAAWLLLAWPQKKKEA